MRDSLGYVIPIIVALIAGLIAYRNATKSHADRLKVIVDLYKDLPPGYSAERRKILEEAMDLEVARIERINNAWHQGKMAYFRESASGPFFWLGFGVGVLGIVLLTLNVFWGVALPGCAPIE